MMSIEMGGAYIGEEHSDGRDGSGTERGGA